MDIKALFKVCCGLYITTVEFEGRRNGCVTNTLMQQSHSPIKLSLTVQKDHFTHELIQKKGSVALGAVSESITPEMIKHFGFVSGYDVDKFAEIPYRYRDDCNGNPVIESDQIAAAFSLSVYDTVDIGTHTLFLCTPDEMVDCGGASITYSQYQAMIKSRL